MLRKALDAFARLDVDARGRGAQARRPDRPGVRRCCEADHVHDGRSAHDLVGARPIFVAKAIERIGDHAKNIAEQSSTSSRAPTFATIRWGWSSPRSLSEEPRNDEPNPGRRGRAGDRRADRDQSAPRRLRGAASPATPTQAQTAIDARAARPGRPRLDAARQSGHALARQLARATAHARAADHHADGARRGGRQGRRPRRRRRRLPHQAVLAARAARAHPGACCGGGRRDALDAAVEVGALRLDPATRRVTGGGREVKIGPTEFRLLTS